MRAYDQLLVTRKHVPDSSSYSVNTHILEHGVIKTEIARRIDDVHQTVMRGVLATQDAQVRAALIQLGWTPPGEKPKHS